MGLWFGVDASSVLLRGGEAGQLKQTGPARGLLGRAGKRDGLRVGLWFWVLG